MICTKEGCEEEGTIYLQFGNKKATLCKKHHLEFIEMCVTTFVRIAGELKEKGKGK